MCVKSICHPFWFWHHPFSVISIKGKFFFNFLFGRRKGKSACGDDGSDGVGSSELAFSSSLLTPPCSFGWLLLSQYSFPWYTLAHLLVWRMVFLHPVFLLEMLFTKTSSCFLSGVSVVSIFWCQTTFLFLLLESSLLFSAYLYHALFWPFWWHDRYHGQRFIPAYRSQSSWACSGQELEAATT